MAQLEDNDELRQHLDELESAGSAYRQAAEEYRELSVEYQRMSENIGSVVSLGRTALSSGASADVLLDLKSAISDARFLQHRGASHEQQAQQLRYQFEFDESARGVALSTSTSSVFAANYDSLGPDIRIAYDQFVEQRHSAQKLVTLRGWIRDVCNEQPLCGRLWDDIDLALRSYETRSDNNKSGSIRDLRSLVFNQLIGNIGQISGPPPDSYIPWPAELPARTDKKWVRLTIGFIVGKNWEAISPAIFQSALAAQRVYRLFSDTKKDLSASAAISAFSDFVESFYELFRLRHRFWRGDRHA